MKVDEAREVLAVALEGGPWPRSAVLDLVAAACGCDPRTVRRAARELGVVTIRRAYWIAPAFSREEDKGQVSLYIEGFPRERLIRHLVCRQEPSAATSDRAREAYLDELRDVMGAEERYEADRG